MPSPLLCALFVFAQSVPVAAQTPEQGAPVHPSRLLIQLRADVQAEEVASAHLAAGGKLLRDLPQIGWQVVEVDPARLQAARAEYARQPAVARADFDRVKRLAYDPNDPLWPGMWHMVKIKADLAWDTHKGAPSVVVGVIDTGLEVVHPDLAANVWVNPGEIPGNGIDDDGNGYVDDVNGYDFAYNDPDPNDVYGHGTSCAGIVASVQDNNLGACGVAPLCKVAGIKAALDSGYFYDSANVPALLYCADMGFQVVSMSFYSDGVTPAERAAIDYCWSKGVVPVAAAGNDQQVYPYYPGAYENTVGVAATNPSDQKSWFSNWGSWVDVAAPGEGIRTTTKNGGFTSGFAGTSGACPHVAGLAALLFSAKPGATNSEVRAALEDTALSLVQAPYGEYTNYGRIDCRAALDRLLGLTSGSKPPRMLFANPSGGGPDLSIPNKGPLARQTMIVYGVGLEAPNQVRVLRNGSPVIMLAQTRNWVEVYPGANTPATLELEVNGLIVDSFQWEPGFGFTFSPTDANTEGNGLVVGGFEELYREDGNLFTCTDNGSGEVYVQLILRKVIAPQLKRLQLEFSRSYAGCTGGTETVRFYDWSSASYPYGSFVTAASTPVTGTATSTLVTPLPPNPARFVDDEGTMYVQITVTNATSAGQLSADSFRIRVR
jgi:subtilisin family serine protease